MTEKLTAEKKLVVGIITTTHGLRGDVKIKSCSGEFGHLKKLKRVEIVKNGTVRYLELQNLRESGKNVVCKFKQIDSIDEAQGLVGSEIWTERTNAAPLQEDEYYIADLCGCSILYDGETRGTVKNVCSGGQGELLEVELESGKKVFIPFLSVYIGEVDIENMRVEVLQDWFF